MRLEQLACALLLLLLGAWGTTAQSVDIPSPPDTDEETNNYVVGIVGVSVPLTDRVDFNLFGAYAGGVSVVKVVQADLPLRVNKYLTLTPGYFGLFLPQTNGRRDRDQRLRGSATVPLSSWGFAFSDRNLFERRCRTSRDLTRYRNQVRVERPLNIRGFAITPFVWNETYYDFGVRAWTRNHTAIGVRRTFAGRYTGDVYYQRENAQNTANNNLVFVALTVRLDRPEFFR